MKRARHASPIAALAAVLAAHLAAACSSSPKPLPAGPPPEYERPRAYDGGVGDAPAAPSDEPDATPGAPRLDPSPGAPPASTQPPPTTPPPPTTQP
ncbi:hypothetical protein [Sorangium sp. So ce1000]|uniref:hypothetical protein n=1 Tax=Sorangium sp. So ce1000 TaxID=3133325 RepID=UPI003F5ECA9E